jgi:hypothetical protein
MNVKGFIMEKNSPWYAKSRIGSQAKSSLSGAGNDGGWFRCNAQSKSFAKSPGEC